MSSVSVAITQPRSVSLLLNPGQSRWSLWQPHIPYQCHYHSSPVSLAGHCGGHSSHISVTITHPRSVSLVTVAVTYSIPVSLSLIPGQSRWSLWQSLIPCSCRCYLSQYCCLLTHSLVTHTIVLRITVTESWSVLQFAVTGLYWGFLSMIIAPLAGHFKSTAHISYHTRPLQLDLIKQVSQDNTKQYNINICPKQMKWDGNN